MNRRIFLTALGAGLMAPRFLSAQSVYPSLLRGSRWSSLAETIEAGKTTKFAFYDVESDSGDLSLRFPVAGTFQNTRLGVPLGTNLTSGPSHWKLMRDGVPIIDEEILPGEDGERAFYGSASIAANDAVYSELTVGAGTSLAFREFQYEFVPDNPDVCVSLLGVNSAGSTKKSANGDYSLPVVGARGTGTVGECQFRIPDGFSGDLKYLNVVLGTVSFDGLATFTVMKNGVPTSIEATATSSNGHGKVEDYAHSVPVTGGDLVHVNWNISGLTVGGVNIEKLSVFLVGTDSFILANGNRGGKRHNAGKTYLIGGGGDIIKTPNTIDQGLVTSSFPFTASHLQAMSDHNGGGVSPHTLTPRVDSVPDPLQRVTFVDSDPSGVPVWREDLVNTSSVSTNQRLDFEIDAPGVGSRDWSYTSLTCNP